MTELEQLNERIAQLSELVKSMEAALKVVEEERDRLVVQQKGTEPKFERVEYKKRYFGVRVNSEIDYDTFIEIGDIVDNAHFRHNNYFHTKERAKEVADKINLLLKLERLHDTFCPDYVPDWNDKDKVKYYVFKNEFISISIWDIGRVSTSNISDVYFPTEDIAKKVCDILNAERSEDK